MKRRVLASLSAIFFSIFVLTTPSYGQTDLLFGINASIEKNPHYDQNYIVGLSVEKQVCQKNSLELGINFRHFKNNFSNEKTDFVFLKNFSISERFLNVTMTSKYHFKYFNVSFGPTVDFLLGWKDKSEVAYPYLEYLDRTAYFGLLTKLSKSISIDKRILIEPELRYNPIFSSITLYSKYVQLRDRQFIGAGVTIKYKL